MTVSFTPNDHGSALHNGGLVEEVGQPGVRGQLTQVQGKTKERNYTS